MPEAQPTQPATPQLAAGHLTRTYETILYATDLKATIAFYRGVLGLRVIRESIEFACAFRLPDGPPSNPSLGGVLLFFDPRDSSQPGRGIPSHGYPLAPGAKPWPGHIAFSVTPGSLESWRQTFGAHNIEIEHEQSWPPGGHSIYVRDPSGHSVELVDGEIWEKTS